MPHAINLRQIEAFKAVIEHGTVSRAAEGLTISQPAVSRLLMHLESDTGLKLFDRHKGRLTPTAQGMRLYKEIDRIFAGVRQVESAIAVVRRQAQGRLDLGIVPALNGAFIQRAIMNFLKRNPKVLCSIQSFESHWIAENILTRKFDVGIITAQIDNPYFVIEPLLEHPLVCIMPIDHALARLKVIRPEHLNGIPFVSFHSETTTGQKIESILKEYDVTPDIVLINTMSSNVCHFVAAGMGVSLVHPLFIAGMENLVIARPFEPATPYEFRLCYPRDSRDGHLISDFVSETKALAIQLSGALTRSWV